MHSSVWEIQYSGLCFAPCIDPHSTRSLLSNLFPPPYRSCGACSVFNEVSTLKQFGWRKEIPNLKLSSTTGNPGRSWSAVTDENQALGPCSQEFACPTLACVSLCVRVFVLVLSSYSGFLQQTTKDWWMVKSCYNDELKGGRDGKVKKAKLNFSDFFFWNVATILCALKGCY